MTASRRPVPMRQLLIAALVALVTCTTNTSAAKCFYKTSKRSGVTTAPTLDMVNVDPASFKSSPLTASPNEQMSDAPDVLEVNSRTGSRLGDPENSLETHESAATLSKEVPAREATQQSSVDSSSTGNSTDGHAPFGDVTSGNDKCVIGNPNAYITTDDVDWVWSQRMAKGVPDFKNFITDQIVHNKGKLSYCVRWDSTEKLSKAVASTFEAMLNRQYKAWNHWLIGYGCWPFKHIEVTIVGWATRDASLFDWSDDSLGQIYTTEQDADGVPQCPETCYKHKDSAASTDTSECKGKPFDMSLWPTLGQGGGAGGDWGQRVDAQNMLMSLESEQLTIVSHEMGHGFGLPDFYKPTDQPNEGFPVCLMKAGSAHMVTPADGWMLRRIYEHLKSRYDLD